MIARQSISESRPALYQPADLRSVLEAALALVVRAWVRIRREKLLGELHRRDEPRTANFSATTW